MSIDHVDKESYADSEEFCPLCMELFDLDDKGFLPCPCGYRICRFCWHRIKTYEDNIEADFEETENTGKCPACRQVYSDVPAGFNSNLTIEAILEQNKSKKKKKRLQNKQKQKQQEEKQKLREILKRDEKSLAGLRVVQKNLVFVIGIPQKSHEELRRQFSKFGKIHKIVIGNTNNSNLNTAYVTYTRPEDAIKTIQTLNSNCTNIQNSQFILNFQSKLNKNSTNTRSSVSTLKASLGTTKYCNHWLKNQQCPKLPDCMYLHELAEQEASFTKEEMQKGKHAEYEKKLIKQYLSKNKNSLDNIELDNLKNNSKNDNNNSNNSLNNFNMEDEIELHYNEDETCQSYYQNNIKNNYKEINNEDNFIKEDDICNQFTNNNKNSSKKNNSNNNINKNTKNNKNNIRNEKDIIKKITRSNNNLINSPQQEIIVINNRSKENNSIGINNVSPKSNFINIEHSNNIKSKFNLLDEIIANSSDSSTSYSTCSSGSNRVSNDLNEITTIENFNTLKLLENKFINKNSIINKDVKNVKNEDDDEDDGLDFDPISISTIGLQDLLKSGTKVENNLNINHSLKQHQILSTNSISNSISRNIHTNSCISSNHQNQHNESQIKTNEKQNFNNTYNSNYSQPQTNNDLNDTWKNSLRALLPNVNITFANSSSNRNNIYLKQQQFSQIKSPLNFNQQNSIQHQKSGINSNFFNFQQSIKQQTNLFDQPQPQHHQIQQQQQQQQQQPQQQQPQQPQPQQPQPQQQQKQQPQLQPQSQQQPIYPLTLLQQRQQQLIRQQQLSTIGINFPYANYFLPQQSKQSILQQPNPHYSHQSQNQQNSQNQVQPSQHLNLNLQRFFSQNFYTEPHGQQTPPPPGFANF